MKEGKKSWMEKAFPVLVAVLLVMAFVMGVMWNKIQNGGSGSTTGGTTASKYKTIKDALKAYGKEVKLDVNKWMSCIEGGSKAEIVSRDQAYGASLGVSGTPGFFVNGRFLAGAFPYNSFKEVIDRELEGKGSDLASDYTDPTLAQGAAQGGFIPAKKDVLAGDSAWRGGENAAVEIVEFSDFQCPYCELATQTVSQIQQVYGDKVRVVYKHFPLDFHIHAKITAEAFECAREQGKEWELHDILFGKFAEWSVIK